MNVYKLQIPWKYFQAVYYKRSPIIFFSLKIRPEEETSENYLQLFYLKRDYDPF